MKTFLSFKTATKFAFLFIGISIFFFACKKMSDVATPIDPVITITPADLTTKVNSSVSGFVTDGNDIAVKDASVQIGTSTVLTDKYGYFEVRNVQVVQNAAMVTVNKTGFFKGIKTYIASANKSAFFRIKLISKISSGTVNASTGGVVTLASGLIINFPANAIVNASTNVAYTGVVTVAASYINPTAADLNSTMPGDLRGLNTYGELKLLTTYGMAAVELTGASGELLQISTGKKATLTMPIPTALSATAPTTIPLWFFNEVNGLWKQEGIATKNGSVYIGDVGHFSFWNCDVPNNYVQFNCTVVNTTGQPVQNAVVKISLASIPQAVTSAFTDSSGYLQGAVPDNMQLKLEVFASNDCNNAVFSQTFNSSNLNINYGNVIINTPTSLAIITGSITNCNNNAVSNGYVMMHDGYNYSRYTLSNTGTFLISKILCGIATTNVTLIGEDIINGQQSNPTVYPISVGTNAIPTIQACGTSTAQYVNFIINGVPTSYIVPTDSFVVSTNTGPGGNLFVIIAKRIPFFQGSTTYIGLSNFNIAQGSFQYLEFFNTSFFTTPPSTMNPGLGANITEYGGAFGQFVAGNFSGLITGPGPLFTVNNVTCNFRVRVL